MQPPEVYCLYLLLALFGGSLSLTCIIYICIRAINKRHLVEITTPYLFGNCFARTDSRLRDLIRSRIESDQFHKLGRRLLKIEGSEVQFTKLAQQVSEALRNANFYVLYPSIPKGASVFAENKGTGPIAIGVEFPLLLLPRHLINEIISHEILHIWQNYLAKMVHGTEPFLQEWDRYHNATHGPLHKRISAVLFQKPKSLIKYELQAQLIASPKIYIIANVIFVFPFTFLILSGCESLGTPGLIFVFLLQPISHLLLSIHRLLNTLLTPTAALC